MSQRKLDVLVPTWNNEGQMIALINSLSIIGFFSKGDRRLIVINNGKQPIKEQCAEIINTGNMLVIDCEENRGWEGGLVEGLKASDAEFVCFQNDDTHIPQNGTDFYDKLMDSFTSDAGIIAPISTTAAGIQSIYNPKTPIMMSEVRWVIFLCAMMKRSDLDAVGGVDETLPGGDDFDLSIRMRKAGKKLYVNPYAFLIHHGFQTGTRVKGDSDKEGGWNSLQMQERTNKALIQKHGFRTFIETLQRQIV